MFMWSFGPLVEDVLSSSGFPGFKAWCKPNGSIKPYGIYLGLNAVSMSLFLVLCMYHRATWTHWEVPWAQPSMPRAAALLPRGGPDSTAE